LLEAVRAAADRNWNWPKTRPVRVDQSERLTIAALSHAQRIDLRAEFTLLHFLAEMGELRRRFAAGWFLGLSHV
jgi:hypothetical protein